MGAIEPAAWLIMASMAYLRDIALDIKAPGDTGNANLVLKKKKKSKRRLVNVDGKQKFLPLLKFIICTSSASTQ